MTDFATNPAGSHTGMSNAPVAAAETAIERLAAVRASVAKSIVGQDAVVELTLAAIMCGGHALIVGAPGLAKTRLVATLGRVLGLHNTRVQFTPDLMPADILGAEVLDQDETGRRSFRFVKGPVFTQLLMADEINRASPRTQSALLQAMQEHTVTVAGQSYALPEPFHVLATQNPIEQEGTYPLPEAQLDRFLFQVDVDYPTLDEERAILLATTGSADADADPVLTAEDVVSLQKLVRAMPIGEQTVEAILKLVRQARPGETTLETVREGLLWGPGPRAGQALMLGVRARALLQGRLAPSVEDVVALAPAVLRHRVALTFGARANGLALDDLIEHAVKEIA